jgi:hypothetical protein
MDNTNDTQYLTKEAVLSQWGEEFKDFIEDPRVKFTQDHIEIGLKFPIAGPEDTIRAINMVIPSAGMLRQLDDVKGDVAKALVLVRVCSGLPQATIDKIKAPDFTFIQKAAAAFL